MKYPKISVVIPSYNQDQFIEITLLSVLDQNYPELECIVIDGGSTDNSVDIIKKYADRLSYWVSEPDKGQTDALIKGFNRATGEIMCWLNSDDLFQHGALKEAAEFFQNNPEADAVFGDTTWFDEHGNPLREQREMPFNWFIWMYTHNYIPGMSMFWRRSIYEKVGGLNSNFDLAMDADLWIRFADVGKIAHVRKQWSMMRFYPEQKNRKWREKSDHEDMMIRSRYWGTSKPALYSLKKALAMSLRIAWKFYTGCYSFGYKRYLER